MLKKYGHLPLVARAFEEASESSAKAGRPMTEEAASHFEKTLGKIETYLDRTPEEKENLMAATLLILAGGDYLVERDISGYAAKYNDHISAIAQEFKNGVDWGPTGGASKDALQIEACEQISVFEYYLDKIAQNPEEARGRKEKFFSLFYNHRMTLDPPDDADRGAPRLKELAREVLGKLTALVDSVNPPGQEQYQIVRPRKTSTSSQPERKEEMSKFVKIVNEADFEEEVVKSDKPVLVDFYADWCPPCKALAPVLEEFAAERQDVKVVKINTDDNQNLARKFNIRSIPTLFVLDKGEIVEPASHARSKTALNAVVDKAKTKIANKP